MSVEPIRAKELFNALRLHFTSTYDFHLYHGKTRSVKLTEKDVFFNSISNRLLTEEKIVGFYLANFIKEFERSGKITSFAGDIRYKENFTVYFDWVEKLKSLHETFEKELVKCTPKEFFIKYCQHEISLETFAITISLFESFHNKMLTEAPDPYIIPELLKFAKKYTPFILVDRKPFQKIIINKFTS